MTYTELIQAIQDATENTDTTFVANIPVFVKNAEKRIYQAVKIPNLRKNQTGYFVSSNAYLTLPTDYISAWEVAVISSGSYTYLLPKDVSFIREAYPSPTTTGTPKYYAQFDDNTLFVGPTPSSALQVEMHYFYYPTSIVTASTTWLGTNFDNVLLYGSLVEAAAFMKSEEDITKTYQEQYAVNLKLLSQYASGKLNSSDYRK
jgi:hypothetical protein